MPAAGARRLRLAVLISGRGSNFVAIAQACADGRLDADVVLVAADVADAGGLAAARERGIEAIAIPWTKRTDFEAELTGLLASAAPDLVILAGFMRVLSADFVARYAGRMLNIHPSLLPAYKGLHTHERALAAGDAEHGASVHLVTAALDGGPLLLQARVPVLAGDTADSLSARVQRQEHIIYPQVIQWIAEGRLTCKDGTPRFDGATLDAPLQQH